MPPDLVETLDQRDLEQKTASRRASPGLIAVFSRGRPLYQLLPLRDGGVEIGRGTIAGVTTVDDLMSRRHARISCRAGVWTVEDLGSRNGTAVDGGLISAPVRGAPRVLRTGATLFLLADDLGPYEGEGVVRHGEHVVGARLGAAWALIRKAAGHGTLHITGETGAGKEIAARVFHEAGPHPEGPFVAVNCAAIPEGVAERLLFGTKRGAYSGATADADGYLQAADGGTLFLDEIGELDAAIQAKLLRVLETREVLSLGAARPVKVDLRLCSATHRDLRQLVSEKKFREDLYFRIGRPHVAIPPLRERLEEMPHLILQAVRSVDATLLPHAMLVETCLMRSWRGNVRELLAEVAEATRHAALDPTAEGQVMAKHLAATAGVSFGSSASGRRDPEIPGAAPAPLPDPEVILEALKRHGGRVATAARALGLRRNQLRRWLASRGIDPVTLGPAGAAHDDDEGDE